MQAPTKAPRPDQFHTDPRVHYDRNTSKWQYEDDQSGAEFEWNDTAKVWIPVVREPAACSPLMTLIVRLLFRRIAYG